MNSGTDTHPRVLMSALLDGELSPQETALVERHLAGCLSCRELLEDYRVIATSTASLATPPVATDLRARINHRLDAAAWSGPRRPWFRPSSYRLALGAAAGVVLVLGLWILRQDNAPDRGAHLKGAQATTESAAPAPATKAADGVSVAEVPRNEPGEAAGASGAPRHRGGSAQPQGRVVSSAVPGRQDSVAPGEEAEVFQENAPEATDKDALRRAAPKAVGLERATKASGGLAPSAPPPASPQVAPRLGRTHGRILLFEFPDHMISLSEDGTLSLSSGQYACTVRAGQPGADREVARLFELASQEGARDTGSKSPAGSQNASIAGVITLQDERGSALRATGGEIAREIDAATAVEMDARLRTLMRDRYIALLESRCGAVPQAVHSR